MGDSFSQWDKVEGGSNASLAELKGLSKLTTLEIQVRDAQILPQDLVLVELQRYKICIGEAWRMWGVTSEISRLVRLHGLENVSTLLENYGMKMLLKEAEEIHLNELKGVQNAVHELDDGEGFPRLKHLRVESCSEILHIVGSVGRVRRKVFPLLESLSLKKASFVILHGQKPTAASKGPEREKPTTSLGFNEIIAADDPAPKVRLPRLEVLLIELMDNLRKIWHHQLASESSSKLKNLEIIGCDNLMNIFPPLVQFPSLEELHISSMVKLRKIWQHQLVSESFNKLKNLGISVCDNLVNIFPPLVGIPSSLVNLTIRQCEKIEEIIGHVGEEVKENRIVFNELKLLKLYDLPRLKSFCLKNYALEFPSLEEVSITHCLNMKTFSQGILSTPKLHEVRVVFLEKSLKLSHFTRLREIWHNQALSVGCISNLQELVVDDCMNMSSAIPANLLRYLNKLEDLVVSNCDSLEEVLHLEELNAGVAYLKNFLSICYLKLIDLPKLKRLCNFTENIIELPKLLTLTIVNCATMETFLSNSTSVLHMTAHHKQPLFDEKVGFPRLGWLKLSRLPNVLCLWNENFKSNKVLPQLNTLKISECSKLQKLGPSLWHLENLGILEVSKCDGLVNLSTLSTSKSIVNLQSMKIADCKTIAEIIQSQVGEEAKDCIVFGKLEYLGLDCLPSLTSFYSGNYTLEFPSLKQVLVRQCPKMKIFSQGIIGTPTLNKVKLTEKEEGCWEGNLNDTIHKLFNEMVSIN
ncbi:uncharacterized protein LOC107178241 [Citrus sinensis]|nr:uncharacterized protein LOC107178241 [Citrus sinensis]